MSEATEGLVEKAIAAGSLAAKLVTIGVISLGLLIGAEMISSLVNERAERRESAVSEMTSSWSTGQVIKGPVLAVPVRTRSADEKGKPLEKIVTAYFLPEALDVKGSVAAETLHRGIYQAAVYTADLNVQGEFRRPEIGRLGLGEAEPLWDRAVLALGLWDLRGVKDGVAIQWDGRALPLEAGTGPAADLKSGLSAPLPAGAFDAGRPVKFSFPLRLKGSRTLAFVPVGKTTTVALDSTWAAPKFYGAFLPDSRQTGPKGFAATWKVLDINRDFPQQWTGEECSPRAEGEDCRHRSSTFGVELLIPVDQYTSTARAVKYAVLYVFFAFLVFFFIEFHEKRKVHPIQYLLVGAGVVLFYLLLLSLSEQVPFAAAYAAASLCIMAVIGGYTHGVFGKARLTAMVTGVLGGLYGFLYTLLRLEDYALLLGSFGLLGALAAIMYLTRNVDWYGLERARGAEARP